MDLVDIRCFHFIKNKTNQKKYTEIPTEEGWGADLSHACVKILTVGENQWNRMNISNELCQEDFRQHLKSEIITH